MRWMRWHCPPGTEFEIRALVVWGRARYFSVTDTIVNLYEWRNILFFWNLNGRRGSNPRSPTFQADNFNHFRPRVMGLCGVFGTYWVVFGPALMTQSRLYRVALIKMSYFTLGNATAAAISSTDSPQQTILQGGWSIFEINILRLISPNINNCLKNMMYMTLKFV